MASVQELLLALNAKKSPFMSLAEGVTQGFGQGYAAAPDREATILKIQAQRVAMQQEKEDRARRAEAQAQLRAEMAGAAEERNRAAMRDAGSDPAPVMPGMKLQAEYAVDEGGDISKKVKTVEGAAPVARLQAKPYQDKSGKARIGNYDPATGKMITSEDDLLAPASQSRNETTRNLRREFIDRPEVKEYVTIGTQVKSMDAMLSSALAGDMKNQLALDQSLITMYNKLTDPTSVVRESEYARTPENLPVVNRIAGALEKVSKGGAGLTNDDRKALVVGAKVIANERGKVFNERRAEYTDLARRLDADPEVVTGTIKTFVPYVTSDQRTQIPVVAPSGTAPAGWKIIKR